MTTFHTYTTTIISEDGYLAAEVYSLPHFFSDIGSDADLESAAEALGVQLGTTVNADSLAEMLLQLAFETTAGKRTARQNFDGVRELVDAVVSDPIVVVEESPASGTTLKALAGQGTVVVLIAEGKPFLALAAEGAMFVVWFVAGPIKGLREAAHDATKTVATELLERWLRERFSRKHRRNR